MTPHTIHRYFMVIRLLFIVSSQFIDSLGSPRPSQRNYGALVLKYILKYLMSFYKYTKLHA